MLTMPSVAIEGQLSPEERQILINSVLNVSKKPQVVIEVGTWLGGGSTLHLLRALETNGVGHLWGIEVDSGIYERMVENITKGAPEAVSRFTPIFGFSQVVIPKWLAELPRDVMVDLAFLDGGDNPDEQITEFNLLNPRIPVGGQLLSHDANLRKGKWLAPYVSQLDNWKSQVHQCSIEGLFQAEKIRENPSPESLRKAKRLLTRMRLEPVEFLGRIMPKSLCGLILRILPTKLMLAISQGRRSRV